MSGQSELSRRDKLRQAVEHAAHLLPKQGPIGVFVHHNSLHTFQHLPFEQAVTEASRLFGAEPYMTESAYRAELARGRIRLEDIDEVLASEPDSVVFPKLSRHSLRRAMMTPGVREFDAATILWRAEQGDLARDFRQPALRALVGRLIVPLFPHTARDLFPLLSYLALATALYVAIRALSENSPRRLLALLALSQSACILAGLESRTAEGSCSPSPPR